MTHIPGLGFVKMEREFGRVALLQQVEASWMVVAEMTEEQWAALFRTVGLTLQRGFSK